MLINSLKTIIFCLTISPFSSDSNWYEYDYSNASINDFKGTYWLFSYFDQTVTGPSTISVDGSTKMIIKATVPHTLILKDKNFLIDTIIYNRSHSREDYQILYDFPFVPEIESSIEVFTFSSSEKDFQFSIIGPFVVYDDEGRLLYFLKRNCEMFDSI